MEQIYKKMQNGISLLLVCAMILSLWSCAKDPTQSRFKGEEGISVNVSLNFKIPSFNTPEASTKGALSSGRGKSFSVRMVEGEDELTRSSGTTPLYNLWIFQFNSSNEIVKVSKLSDMPEAVKDMVTIDTELITGEDQTIYLVSLGKQYNNVDLSGITTISELENYTLNTIKYENGIALPIITSEEDIPYRGSFSGLNVVQIENGGKGYVEYDPSDNFSGAIPIYAMVSKVTFDFSYDNSGFVPNILMLNNVPTSLAINNSSYKATSFANIDAVDISKFDFRGGKRYVMNWYMASNLQGSVPSIVSEYNRYYYFDTSLSTPAFIGSAPANGTYINLWASETAKQDSYAIYYIFLGSNTTNDFNIYPHSSYKIKSDINSVDNQNDKRIVYKKLSQTVDISASAIAKNLQYTANNKYERIGIGYDFDAHASMRPIEISALRGRVKIGIFSDKNATIPVSKADSWIKLSAYPNYTEAFNKANEGDVNGLETSLIHNASIPGLFMSYIYSDAYDKYTTGDPRNEKRTLYIRVDFESGSASDYVIYQFNQLPGFYLDRFGGKFNETTGEYSHGLVYEGLNESSYSVKYLSYHATLGLMSKGGFDTNYDNLYQKYKIADLHSGKEASLLCVMNKEGYALASSNFTTQEAPRYVNGKLDLYQYAPHKRNYYAARYCFDKNRDLDGDGDIEGDEIVWYLPSYYQNVAISFNFFGDRNAYIYTFADVSTLGSISQSSDISFYNMNVYNLNLTNTYVTNTIKPVCVRDVEPPTDPSYPRGAKVYEEDGYPVIDVTGMLPSVHEDRSIVPSTILRNDGRVIRHVASLSSVISGKTLSSTLSSRFRVATYDIDSLGAKRTTGWTSTGLMSWARASGFNLVGDSWVFTEDLKIRDTGCPIYAGKDGTEKGKWRLPTDMEIYLINIMEAPLSSLSSKTGYVPLADYRTTTDIKSTDNYYWASTEYVTKITTDPIKVAMVLRRSYSVTKGAVTGESKMMTNRPKTSLGLVRCIQDLPAK